MRKWLLAVSLIFLGGMLIAQEADARRLGGGRSVGAQRSVTAPPAKPAQQQAAPQQQPNPQAAPQAGSRWGGILGGLALGGLLGYLFGGSGLMGVVALALIVLLAFALVGALMRGRRQQPAPPPIQLAGLGNETVAAPPPSQASGVPAPVAANPMPPGFDTAGFLRAAKMNFIKLQVANDSGRLDEIREFTTNEMFDELRTDTRGGQHTDVVALNADLLEVATEQGRHWVSVRFSGMVRETPGTEPVGFEEVWNLVKPVNGSSGWLLAGIQQMH
jgi:predicted lipid-binding transport protein (Tim44 family)